VSASDKALLWATRLGTDADTLLRISRATHGIDIQKLSTAQLEAIASVEARAIAEARHAPATRATPVAHLATEPAETLICDGFGWHHAPSPVNGAFYQFHAICEHTSFGYVGEGKTHTVDDWVAFLSGVIADARAQGHKPVRVRFDRAPELRCAEFKQRLLDELGLIVELGSREHHEAVGRAEKNNDILTRMAEAMLQRAQLGTAWLLPARAYAQWLLNRRPFAHGTGETRYQKYLRKIPDLSSPVPLTFGTTVSVVEDVRGPKGSLDHPRGSIGKFVGIEGSSYLVYREKRQSLVRQHDVRPLNELALIRSSLPSAVATCDSSTQTSEDAPSCLESAGISLKPSALPGPAAPLATPPPTVDVPLDTRIEVLWEVQGSGQLVWYAGKVIDSHTYADGHVRHYVAYDGWPQEKWYWHDLATDDFPWRHQSAQTPAQPSPDPAAPQLVWQQHDPATLKPLPRRSPRLTAAHAFVEAALEASSGSSLSVYEAAIFQWLGDDAVAPSCASADAPQALAELNLVAIYSPHRYDKLSCSKATQNLIDVVTDVGPAQYKVPATLKQLYESEQRDSWIEADRKALDAVLAWPGNRLVPVDVPGNLGIPVAPCVTQRRIKIDQATGRLASENAFKSRHCVDGGRLASLLKGMGVVNDAETASATACDTLVKMFIADAARRGRRLSKADVPNAYPQGSRQERPVTFMELPRAFSHWRDDDGSPLCVELRTPMWGEGPAGYEWQLELERQLLSIGWQRAENVPALWTYTGPEGDAKLITIVDDLLFSESPNLTHSIAEKTAQLLSDRYGDVRLERDPTSYAGVKLTSDVAKGTISLTMPQKIVEAARAHCPELLEGKSPSVPSGAKLQKLADSLELAPSKPSKLDKKQVRIQQLIGSLKFIERVHPRISLVLHRLSCVMSNPPLAAWDVALAALVAVYHERDVGITYGGNHLPYSTPLEGCLKASIDLSAPAPVEMTAHADATWSDRNIYGIILTYAGAAIYHVTKKIALLVDSSMESEAIASSKSSEIVSYAREILRGLGVPADGPTLLTTDNLANLRVGSGVACPSRSKHFLRRYGVLKQRIAQGECMLRHVPDEQMPADFLTKWISKAKLETSLRYATNSHS